MELVEMTVPTETSFDHQAWRSRGAEIAARGRAASLGIKESRRIRDGSLWELGDWLISGEQYLSAAYDEAVSITGLARGTLYNVASVARKFPISRRRENLHFSHYAEVASVENEELQDKLLEHGSKKELSVREMGRLVENEWSKPLARQEQGKKREEEQEERNKKKMRRIAVWLEPGPYELIKRVAKAKRMARVEGQYQPGDVLMDWCVAYFNANRGAIMAEVKELEAKLEQERETNTAEKPEQVSPVTASLTILVDR
jgi:hypothetical protein